MRAGRREPCVFQRSVNGVECSRVCCARETWQPQAGSVARFSVLRYTRHTQGPAPWGGRGAKAMVNIPNAEGIERLVAAGAAESLTLEFKAAPWDRNDQGKREALKDITALANTRGGLILIGVAEEN